MPLARVSSRGQVTLPAEVRQQLNIEQGDELLIDVDWQRQVASFRVIKEARLSDFYGILAASGKPGDKVGENSAVGRYLGKRAEAQSKYKK